MTKVEKDAIRARCEAATPIHGFDGYFVTKDGDVISTTPWRGTEIRILDQYENSHGYMRVRMIDRAGKRCSKFVHKLVANAYLQQTPDDCDQIRHLDGNKKNNSARNLEWGTAKSNAIDRDIHGMTARGERNGAAVLREKDILVIKTMLEYKIPQRKIAELLGVSQRSICHINRMETWRHVR